MNRKADVELSTHAVKFQVSFKKHKQYNIFLQDDVYFENLSIENFNGVNFKEFTENIVYKNETNVTLNVKEYLHGFDARNVYTDYLNSINKFHILTKSKEQIISGPIIINGNVLINDFTVIGKTLNGVPLDYVNKTFEVIENGYKING